MVFFFFGDILAKNTYVGLMVIFKHYFIPLAEGGTADAEIAATAGAEASRMAMRRPSQMITHEMIGMAQEMSPPRSSLAHSSTDRPPSAPGRKPATRQMPTAELEIARGGGGGGGGGGGVRTAAALPDSAAVSAAVQAAVQAGYEHGIKEASFSKQRQSLTRQEAPQEDSDDSDDAPVDRGLHSRLKARRRPAYAHAPRCGGAHGAHAHAHDMLTCACTCACACACACGDHWLTWRRCPGAECHPQDEPDHQPCQRTGVLVCARAEHRPAARCATPARHAGLGRMRRSMRALARQCSNRCSLGF